MKKRCGILFLTFVLLLTLLCSAALADREFTWQGHTYQIVFDQLSWSQARKACEQKGGHLITITSSAEQKMLMKELKLYAPEVYWIGCTDKGHEGDWRWVTGEKWTYENWGENQPDNNWGDANHGSIYNRDWIWDEETGEGINAGEWDDAEDTEGWCCYICEWDPIISSIKLNKTKATLKKGKTLKLKISKILPAEAAGNKTVWSSSNKSVATVDKKGKVKAKGVGTCIITCSADDGSGVSASCKITVKK